MMLKTVAVKELKPNPFRRLEEYPIQREKVDALKESIQSTTFWGTIVGREGGSGVEIAFGHHRLAALRELDPNASVEIIVRDLSNEQMLQMMARENVEEWGTSAWVELETLRATIQAYGEGKIDLPHVGERGPRRETSQAPVKFYTTATIAQFLGWTRKAHDRLQPNFACESAFKALDMIDDGFLDEASIKGLTRAQMRTIVDTQWSIYQSRKRAAEENERAAKEAEKAAKQAEDTRERKRLEIQSQVHRAQAITQAEAAKESATAYGRKAIAELKKGNIGVREARTLGDQYKADIPQEPRVVDVDQYSRKVMKAIDLILCREDPIKRDLDFLRSNALDLSDDAAKDLARALRSLSGRIDEYLTLFSR